MNRTAQIKKLQGLGYTVEHPLNPNLPDEDGNPTRDESVAVIEGHGMLVQIPMQGEDADATWAYYADPDTHAAHLEAREAFAAEPTLAELDEQIAALQAQRERVAAGSG